MSIWSHASVCPFKFLISLEMKTAKSVGIVRKEQKTTSTNTNPVNDMCNMAETLQSVRALTS